MRPLSPLVGRQAEHRLLLDALTSVPGKRAGLLIGKAGVGKARLASAVAGAALDRHAVVASGACLPLGDALRFLPIVEALRGLNRNRGGLVAALSRTPAYVATEAARLVPELGSARAGLT